MKNFTSIIIGVVFFILTGCSASALNSLTPSLSVKHDEWNDTKIISQPPVSAAASMSEAWHTLGFTWNQNHPDFVILKVGVDGIDNVMA